MPLVENQEGVMQDEHKKSLESEAEEAAQQAGTAKPDEAVETMPSMEQMLKTAELAAQEHHDAWLRAKAETENIRRRAQADISSAHKYAVENFSSELLAVKDSLEAALAVDSATVESFKDGVELTLRQLVSVFEKSNIAEINPVGEKFDPHKHQAISMVESDAAPNTVVTVLQKGYQLHDRILRPALVMVAKSGDA
jgi:molecular chaperone GrpE